MNSMKRQKGMTLKDELPGSVGAQYATGNLQGTNSRQTEETEPKQKQHSVMDVTGDRSKIQCCKEQYCYRNLECYIHESRQIGSDQTDGKSKR